MLVCLIKKISGFLDVISRFFRVPRRKPEPFEFSFFLPEKTRYAIHTDPKTGDSILMIENYDFEDDFSVFISNIYGPVGTLYFKKLMTEGLFELVAIRREL